MAYGTLKADVIQSDTANVPPQFNGGNGVQVGTLCRAWVNFNGTGTVAIRASFNVTSITDQAVGKYSVNMTTALPDTNFAFVGSSGSNGSNPNAYFTGPDGDYTLSASTFAFDIRNDGASLVDQSWVSVAVFR